MSEDRHRIRMTCAAGGTRAAGAGGENEHHTRRDDIDTGWMAEYMVLVRSWQPRWQQQRARARAALDDMSLTKMNHHDVDALYDNGRAAHARTMR